MIGEKDMKNTTKAKIILESLDEVINVNWNFEEHYMKAILKALNKIDKEEIETVTIHNIHCAETIEIGKSYDLDVLDENNIPYPISGVQIIGLKGSTLKCFRDGKTFELLTDYIVHTQESH